MGGEEVDDFVNCGIVAGEVDIDINVVFVSDVGRVDVVVDAAGAEWNRVVFADGKRYRVCSGGLASGCGPFVRSLG